MRESRGFELSIRDDVPVVHVVGEVDIGNVGEFEDVLKKASREDVGFVVVSLADAKYFDSRTLAALGSFGRGLERNRQALLLAMPPNSSAARILEISGISQKFRTFATLDEAFAHISKVKAKLPAE